MSEKNYHCRPDSNQPQPQGGIITDAAREAAYETHYNESGGPHWITRRKSDGRYFAYHYIREAADQLTEMLNERQRAIDAATADYRTTAEVLERELDAKDREIAELRKPTPQTDREDRPYPSPEYAQRIRFEGAECVAISPEEYEALYEQSRSMERERDTLRAEVERLNGCVIGESRARQAAEAEVERLNSVVNEFIAGEDGTDWKARAEKAEAEVERLKEQLAHEFAFDAANDAFAKDAPDWEKRPEMTPEKAFDLLCKRALEPSDAAIQLAKFIPLDRQFQSLENRTVWALHKWMMQLRAQLAAAQEDSKRLRDALAREYIYVAPVVADFPVELWEHLGDGHCRGKWAEDGSPYGFKIPEQLVPAFFALQRLACICKGQHDAAREGGAR